jgi:mannonate dehydratase
MRFALYLPVWPNDMWTLGPQMDVEVAVTGLPVPALGQPPCVDFESFVRLKTRFADAGLDAEVIEASPPMDNIKLGLPGRDEEFETVSELITNMGAAGFKIWCYNWMAKMNWLRTSVTTRGRGGALVTSYDHALMRNAPLTDAGEVDEEQMWDAYAWFVERIVPVAEAAGVKLAVHPDDPPLSPIRGIPRIMRSPEGFARAMALHASPNHGMTFCQGNFAAMNADIPANIRKFGATGKMHFVHFRDVRGTPEKFEETFHDEGPTDMLAAMAAYHEIGFDGPMRPDHVPTMHGDINDPPGYTTFGRLYAIGYMKGLAEGVEKAAQ